MEDVYGSNREVEPKCNVRVFCDILLKYGASHVSARATLSNSRSVRKKAVERCVYIFEPLCILVTRT